METLNGYNKPRNDLKDRTVLIVDDILDMGLTLSAIVECCKDQSARFTYTAALVDKRLDHKKPVKADFVGLEVENCYVFGYSIGYKGYLRNLS